MESTKQQEKNTLDSSLRNLYCTLRNKGASLVAIEFKHGGKTWRADTAAEALEMKNLLDEQDKFATMSGEELTSDAHAWTPDVTKEFLESLGELQKAFIRELFQRRVFVTSQEIREALSLKSEIAFAGVLSGLSKQAKKLELMPGYIYEVMVTWKGKGKTRSFKLTHSFRWALDEIGWPDNWT